MSMSAVNMVKQGNNKVVPMRKSKLRYLRDRVFSKTLKQGERPKVDFDEPEKPDQPKEKIEF